MNASNLKSKIENLKFQCSPKVVVLAGGPSAEHEISLKSGHGVVEALRQRGWGAELVIVPQRSVGEAAEFARQALKASHADVVFIALHGPFGEDGTIQRICESLHLPYTGSDAPASQLGMDKLASRLRFAGAGLAVPPWRLLERPGGVALARCGKELGFPLVVKPTNQGSSIGVSIVRRAGELREAVAAARRFDSRVLIEEWIQGRELTVGVLGSEPLPIVEIRPASGFFDFQAKYTPGQTEYLVPATLDQDVARRVQAAGLLAHQALGCRHFSRTDLILTPDLRAVVLEVNTIPGLTATSLLPKAARCVGIAYDELCDRMVSMALESVEKTSAVESGTWKVERGALSLPPSTFHLPQRS
ncbi:MAG: D-alanine--D-alanine ligase [Candidatus Omnitrophica bacterium]|nr:D-alanine--D-alanine ligase [Candidatus Omnitrophota bacterium]